ncbi:MAG: calcium/proton exchanger [Bacteroidales bacterium]|nr:calcium/proton exchanger [Bacteroidales bacterium]
MKPIINYLKSKPIALLLIALPMVVIAEVAHWGGIWVFIFSAIGVIPMAGYIGEATESLAVHTGPKIGGLLNATLGNAAELIITLVAIRSGLLELVKASITGSIIGNLLLILGLSMLLGGIRNGTQKFDKKQTSNHAILLTLAILALIIPSFFSHYIGDEGSIKVELLSLGVAGIMVLLYGLGLVYSLKGVSSPLTYNTESKDHHPTWSIKKSLIVLSVATIAIVFLSEALVGAIESVVEHLGFSEFFLGIILIPIVGNVAEHLVAVKVATENKMDLSVEIAVSSSLQIALFVAPLLVFVSLLMGNPLTLIFNQFELIALGAGVLIAVMVSSDGESNWLEGAALFAVYLILALAFFFMPS